MKYAVKLLALATILATGSPQLVAGPQTGKGSTKKTPQKSEGASLSGCVDQQEGQYVLVDDHDLKVIANLEAEGFPTEGFAKHMGEKVIVRGSQNPGDARPVFKVHRIETVSDTCAPQASSGGKK
ncbi:MAG TPA: hypothetical protein VMH28_09195 [Candidatus Acidoferrales bacterium]|nr:hypothetical protein [Candidatus Acidoferrales bacterium]